MKKTKAVSLKIKVNPEWKKQYKIVQKELAKLAKIKPVLEVK